MGWRTLIINKHSKVSYKNNHLVFKSIEETEMIHLSEIDTILFETTDISVTTMLLKRLIDEKILVIFCDDKRLPSSFLCPYYAKHDCSLQLSKQILWNEDFKAHVWTEIISQKISNQIAYLNNLKFLKKAESIEELYNNLEKLDPTNREGHAARIYFNTLFGNDFCRDSPTDVNAGLDYGYSIIMSMFAREIVASGCVTQIGLKHANQFNQFNLACDFMEPFRVIVDNAIYKNRYTTFPDMKKALFEEINKKFIFNEKEMYLNNIISEYTKKLVKSLNNEDKNLPEFKI
ncbi:MAG: type II CRISPR-associated endonuclease Cas1 [Erysipelotrichaceae bacterium]|nr:type II CRISPR-associated endonuclease Cas1 [Erysipelotrichaceae bacterium]